MTACTRSRNPSFMRMRPTWDFTVASVTESRSPISVFVSPRDGREDFPFPLCQRCHRFVARRGGVGKKALAEEVLHPAADPGGNGGVSCGDGPKGREQLSGPDVLEQETTGTGPRAAKAYSSRSNVVRTITRESGTPRQCAGWRDAVGAGHPHVHQHHVRCQGSAHVDATAAVGGLAHNLHAVLGSRTMRKPARTSVWSSTSRTRIERVDWAATAAKWLLSAAGTVRSRTIRRRSGTRIQDTAVKCDALTHSRDPMPRPVAGATGLGVGKVTETVVIWPVKCEWTVTAVAARAYFSALVRPSWMTRYTASWIPVSRDSGRLQNHGKAPQSGKASPAREHPPPPAMVLPRRPFAGVVLAENTAASAHVGHGDAACLGDLAHGLDGAGGRGDSRRTMGQGNRHRQSMSDDVVYLPGDRVAFGGGRNAGQILPVHASAGLHSPHQGGHVVAAHAYVQPEQVAITSTATAWTAWPRSTIDRGCWTAAARRIALMARRAKTACRADR